MERGYVVMNKDINDQKYKDYKKNKLFRYLYVFLAILVIIGEILVLFNVINVIWGIVFFIILYLLKKILIK